MIDHIIFAQENQTCTQGRTLVPIDEGVIAADIKQVSCRDLRDIFEDGLAKGSGLGGGNSRFQHSTISQARCPAVGLQNHSLYCFDSRDGKMLGRVAHDKRRNTSL